MLRHLTAAARAVLRWTGCLALAALPGLPWAAQSAAGVPSAALPAAAESAEAASAGPADEFSGTLHRTGALLLAGQPTAAGLVWAAAHGVTTVVDLRTDAEHAAADDGAGFDEPAVAADLGLEYVQLPLGRSEASWTPAALERFAAVMQRSGGSGVLLHCASGRRASYLWAAWLVRHRGMPLPEALVQAPAATAGSPLLAGLLGEAPVPPACAADDASASSPGSPSGRPRGRAGPALAGASCANGSAAAGVSTP